MKQSSITWITKALQEIVLTEEQVSKTIGLFVQAQEMHKDEIVDAFRYGNSNEILGKKHPEEYYNETFNTKEK